MSASGTFTLTVILPPGVNTIEVVAQNPDGSSAGTSTILQLGPPQTVSGVVRGGPQGADQPLQNVPVSIEGTSATTLTAADGTFSIPGVPTGNQVLNVNASSITGSGGGQFGITRIGVAVVSTSVVVGEVILRPINYSAGTPITFLDGAGTISTLTVTNPSLPYVSATVGAGTLTLPVGAPATLTVSQVSMLDLPIPIPPTLASSLFVSLGPEGMSSTGPITLTFPNADGVPPGGTTPLWHYDPKKGSWIIVGTGTADRTGTTLTSDPSYSGAYAFQSPKTIPETISLTVFDENGVQVPIDISSPALSLQVFGTDLVSVGLTEYQLNPNIASTSPQLSLQFTVPEALPFVASIRITRFLPSGAATTVTVPVTFQPGGPDPLPLKVCVGQPANIQGTVVAARNNIIVRNAVVSLSTGVSTTTDDYGRFNFTNVQVYSTTPAPTPAAAAAESLTVTATKFVGMTFTGQSQPFLAGQAAGGTYDVGMVTINADLDAVQPLFTAQTIQSGSVTTDNGFSSLVYQPQLQRFYTEDISTNQIWEVDGNGFGATVGGPLGFGAAGLQRGTLAVGTGEPFTAGSGVTGALWAADGHIGSLYSIVISQTGEAPTKVNLAATNLNPLWPGQVVTPLLDHFESSPPVAWSTLPISGQHEDAFGVGNAIVEMGAYWYETQFVSAPDISVYYVITPHDQALGGPFGTIYSQSLSPTGYAVIGPAGSVNIENATTIFGTSADALAQPGNYGYLFFVGPGDIIFGSGPVAVTTPSGGLAITSRPAIGAPSPPPGGPLMQYASSTQNYLSFPDAVAIGHSSQLGTPPFFVSYNSDLYNIASPQPVSAMSFTPVGTTSIESFTPTVLAFAAADHGDTTMIALTNDASIPGLGTWGTSVVALNLNGQGSPATIYAAPPGSTLVGLCTAPDAQTNATAIFVLQTNQQAVVSPGGSGTNVAQYEMIELKATDSLYTIWDNVIPACTCGNGINPVDCDGDGLPNSLEVALGTDPCNPVTYGDGLNDYVHAVNLGVFQAIPLPAVVRAFPQPGAANVLLDTPLYVDFNQAMDAATLGAAFTLVAPGVPTTTGTFTVTLGSTPERAIFNLTSGSLSLSPNVTYTATITVMATDIFNRPLSAPFSWTFTTGSNVSNGTDGYGLLNIERQYYGLPVGPGDWNSMDPLGNIPDFDYIYGLCNGVPMVGGSGGTSQVPSEPTTGPVTPPPSGGDDTLDPDEFSPANGQTDVPPTTALGIGFNGPLTGVSVITTTTQQVPSTTNVLVALTDVNGNTVPGQAAKDPNSAMVVAFTPAATLAPLVSYTLIVEVFAPYSETAYVTSEAVFMTGGSTVEKPISEIENQHSNDSDIVQSGGGSTTIYGLTPTSACTECGFGPYAKNDWLSVVMNTGNLIFQALDDFIHGRCPPFEVKRTYRSNDFPYPAGIFGTKWHFNYDTCFIQSDASGDLTYITEDGRYYPFSGSSATGWTPYPGFDDTTEVAVVSPSYFSLPQGNLQGAPYILQRKKDGTRYYYAPVPQKPNDVAYLVRIQDRNEQSITFFRDPTTGRLNSVVDTIGRTTTFTYWPTGSSGAGNVQTIQDHSGRFWEYLYNMQGELSEVQTPATSYGDFDDNGNFYGPVTEPKYTDYTYQQGNGAAPGSPSGHLLETITVQKAPFSGASSATASARATYSPANNRVSQLDYGAGTYFFNYDYGTGLSSRVDQVGTLTQMQYDVTNLNPVSRTPTFDLLSVTTFSAGLRQPWASPPELASYTTSFVYDQNHEVVQVVMPAGNAVRRIRDQFGDVLQNICLGPAPTPSAPLPAEPSIITEFEYEPVFHMPRRMTEPRGNVDDPSNPSVQLLTMATQEQVPSPSGTGFASPRVYTPLSIQAAVERDAYSTYFFYDHENVVSTIAAVQSPSDMDVPGLWSLVRPLPVSYGRPVGADPPDYSSVFVSNQDGDLLPDRGGNLYVVRGPRPQVNPSPTQAQQGVASSAWTYSTSGPQVIEWDFTYTYYGQNILAFAPDGTRTRLQWNVAPFDLSANPDAGYLKVREAATAYVDTDFSGLLGPYDATTTTGGGLPPATPSGTGLNLQTTYVHNSVAALLATTDPGGNTWSRTVDALNLISQETAPQPFAYTKLHTFDSRNNRIQDQIQNVLESGFVNPGATPTLVAGSNAYFTNQYHFNVVNFLVESDLDATGSTPSLLTWTYQRDPRQRITAVRQPAGNYHTIAYDERDLVVSRTLGASDPLTAQTIRYQFDANENLAHVYNDTGGSPVNPTLLTGVQTCFDQFDRPTKTIDETGEYTCVRYDAASHVTDVQRTGYPAGPTLPVPTSPMQLLAHTVVQVDEAGRTFQTDSEFYDELTLTGHSGGRLVPPVTTVNPIVPGAGLVRSVIVLDPSSKVLQTVDDNANATTFGYDQAQRNYLVTDALGSTLTRMFDANSLTRETQEYEQSTDPTRPSEVHYTEFFYDQVYRLTARVDDLGNTDRWLFDSRSNVIETADAMNAPSGVTLGSLRSNAGVPGVVLNLPGNTTRMTYDGMSRLIETDRDMRSDGTGATAVFYVITTKTSWDGDSRVFSRTDANGNVTSYCYDDQNRLIRTTYANGTRRDLVWVNLQASGAQNPNDRQSTVKLEIDPRNVVKEYAYDAKRRRISLAVPSVPVGGSQPGLQTANASWQWDGMDRLTYAKDDDSVVQQQFDSLGDRTAQTQSVLTNTAGTVSFATQSAFDGVGRRLSITYPQLTTGATTSPSLTITQGFDNVDRLNLVSSSVTGTVAQYQHIGMGSRRLSRLYGNGVKLTINYDQDRRPQSYVHTGSAGNVKEFDYTWDRAGNRKSETDATLGIGNFYVYDSTYRLVTDLRDVPAANLPQYLSTGAENQVSLPFPSGGNRTDYNLDSANNRTSVNASGMATSYTMNAFQSWTPSTTSELPPPGAILADSSMNQYSLVTDAATPSARNLTYDLDGNEISTFELGNQRYYDCDDQLIESTTATSTTSQDVWYRYDAMGRRLSKSYLDSSGNRHEVVYVREGWETLEEWTPASGLGSTGNATRAKQFVYGGRVDEPLVMTTSGGSYWYHENSIGTIAAISNNAGQVVESYTYKAYGELETISSGSITETQIGNPFFFQGRRRDFEEASSPGAALYYFRSRYYDANLGRFISRDPLGVWGDSGQLACPSHAVA